MASYKDGDRTPLQQIRRSRSRSERSILIVREQYTRTYKNGETATRVSGEYWGGGYSHQDDMDLRSVEKMYPVVVFSNHDLETEETPQ